MFHVSIILLVATKTSSLDCWWLDIFVSHGSYLQIAITLLSPKVVGGWLVLHNACTIL